MSARRRKMIVDNMMHAGTTEDSDWSAEATSDALKTGLVFLRKTRDLYEEKRPPHAWVLTSLPDSQTEYEERAFDFVEGFKPKPCSLKELAKEIWEFLEKEAQNE